MTRRDLLDLLGLAALWGASFLFLRLGAAAFGPVALALLRVAGAAVLLLALLAWRGQWHTLRPAGHALWAVGAVNTALPFVLYGVAALALGAGLMSVFNATAPLWAALIAWAWLGERPTAVRAAGLGLGLAGVVGLTLGKADATPGLLGVSTGWGIVACLGATLMYGWGANLVRRHAAGIPALTLAAGSQATATALLLGPGLWAWPAQTPGAAAWGAAAMLSLACTGLAYLMYFRLIARIGPTRAISVTFLIPAFAALWGALFLGEMPSGTMLAGGGVILLGTALATGLLRAPRRRASG